MYNSDNNGKLVPAFPVYQTWKDTWCAGSATSDGGASSYVYGGADPRGITNGLLWPYSKSLGIYHCPADHRIATAGLPIYKGRPILRTISMNSYLAGRNLGSGGGFTMIDQTGPQMPNAPVYLKEVSIRKPTETFLVLDEDQLSINDGMFLTDMGNGATRWADLPSRNHGHAFGINFCDGHAEIFSFKDTSGPKSVDNWTPQNVSVAPNDLAKFTNFVSHAN